MKGLAIVGAFCLLGACAAGPKVLEEGTVVVSFDDEQRTCGLHNPHEADAVGCTLLDEHAIVCDEFGVIDGMLFAGDCESPASASLLEIRGTSVQMTRVGGVRNSIKKQASAERAKSD